VAQVPSAKHIRIQHKLIDGAWEHVQARAAAALLGSPAI